MAKNSRSLYQLPVSVTHNYEIIFEIEKMFIRLTYGLLDMFTRKLHIPYAVDHSASNAPYRHNLFEMRVFAINFWFITSRGFYKQRTTTKCIENK